MLFASDRLVFDRHRPENFAKLHAWQNDPELLDLTTDTVTFQTEDQTRAALERWINAARDDIMHLAIHLRATGELIGFGQLAFIDRHHRRCKMAIVLGDRARWGQGLGTEAIRRMVRYCFEELDLHRIGCEMFDFNARSIGAFTAAGFQREGVLRESIRRGERYHDEYAYGLLRREWQP